MLYKAYYKLFYLVSFLTVQANKQGLIFPLSFFDPARYYTPQSNTLSATLSALTHLAAPVKKN